MSLKIYYFYRMYTITNSDGTTRTVTKATYFRWLWNDNQLDDDDDDASVSSFAL